MHLHANSMNILTRLQSTAVLKPSNVLQPAPKVRQPLIKSSFELHMLSRNGSMAGQWDGDARRQPGRNAFREEVPVRVEEEVEVVEPATFWG